MSDLHERLHWISRLDYFERRKHMRFIATPSLPRFLYKFRSFDPGNEKSIDFLRDLTLRSRLWLSSPDDFNDPYDMSAKITLSDNVQERRTRIRSMLKEQGERPKNIRRKLPGLVKNKQRLYQCIEHGYNESVTTCGVYSFAGDPRCILMWSHYANNHEGLCFQFERARDVKCLAGALPVTYSDDYPEVDWVNSFAEDLKKVVLRKYSGWRYEDESRIVEPGAAKTYRNFNPNALQGIILGCKVNDTVKIKLHELLEERKRVGYEAPVLYQAVKHDSRFCLVIKRCN